MYDIDFTKDAISDLLALCEYDQAMVVAAIEEQLSNEPD